MHVIQLAQLYHDTIELVAFARILLGIKKCLKNVMYHLRPIMVIIIF